MSIRPDMEELVRGLGATEPAPHAIPIRHDIFVFYSAIAKREGSSPAAVINDQLRKMMGEA